jgi:hypothetical protein
VRLAALAAAASVLAALPAFADRWTPVPVRPPENRLRGDLVELRVLVDGRSASLHAAPGHGGTRYFEALKGEEYALVVRNRSPRRVAVLVAVDGLNVINGSRSHLAPHEPMYVLGPHERTTIRGWRTSLERVQQFVFVDEERSYAARSGQANGDLGWIRVLAFEEEIPVATRYRYDTRSSERERDSRTRDRMGAQGSDAQPRSKAGEQAPPPSEPLAEAARPEAFPGTGWGRERRDRAREVEFEPVAYARDQLVLRYEYARGLEALGIYATRDPDRLAERERGECWFAEPPRW